MDIIILGGGVVGLTMANLLAQQHKYRITLISPPVAQDQRYSAINHASSSIFKQLGVWDHILATPPGVYDQMYLSDEQSGAEITLRASDLGTAELGHIINNQTIINSLTKDLPNLRFIEGMAQQIEQQHDGVKICVNDQEILGKLVIGADGANSWLRRQLQIQDYNWDYQQAAIVATVEMHAPHANTARQRFTPEGPLAFLPLAAPNLCSIVWSTTPNKAATLMQMSEPEFAAELEVAKICTPRIKFPLRMQHAQHYTAPRAVLIGDAAHVIHPLAGQGMNLGLLDAATLAECLEQVADPGALRVLRKYERRRKTQTWSTIALMEGCKRLFETRNPVINTLRSFGMQTLDKFIPGKNILAKVGMGVLGELPTSTRSYV